jgi:hypothetical protein
VTQNISEEGMEKSFIIPYTLQYSKVNRGYIQQNAASGITFSNALTILLYVAP